MKKSAIFAAVLAGTVSAAAIADSHDSRTVDMMFLGENSGQSAGSVEIRDHDDGVLFIPDLQGLTPGVHGFHVHENPSCDSAEKDGKMVPGGAAGGHFNPGDGDHNGPYEKGHDGDLPVLYVDQSGNASTPVLATNLDYDDLNGRSLMIHEGGDNYSDQPEPLGGGGARVACGVIAEQ